MRPSPPVHEPASTDPGAPSPGGRSWHDRFGRPPRGPVLLGAVASVMIMLGSFGAGGVLVRDPVLSNSPLGFWRYGHGHTVASALVLVGVGLMLLAWVRIGRGVLAGEVGGRAVLTTAAVWLVPMLFAAPLFTRDVFSYLAQGALPLAGIDPYAYGPEALPGQILENVHPWWQDIPAPYGPLFILIAKAVALVAGDNVIVGVVLMRLAMLPGLALFVWAVPVIARRVGGRVPVALWIAVANPVTVVHLVGGIHNDLVLMGLLAAGTALVLRGQHAGGIAVATAAVAVKASAGLALPFLVLIWAARLQGSWRSRVARAAGAGVAVAAAVFVALTLLAGVGLGWVNSLGAGGAIVTWYSIPTALGMLGHTIVAVFVPTASLSPFIAVTRALGLLALLAFAVHQWWRVRDGGPDVVRRAGIVLLAAAVLGPTLLSWYPSWGIALLAATAFTTLGLRAVAFATVLLMYTSHPNGDSAHTHAVLLVTAVALGVLAAVSLTRRDPLRLRAAWAAVPTGWTIDGFPARFEFWSRWHFGAPPDPAPTPIPAATATTTAVATTAPPEPAEPADPAGQSLPGRPPRVPLLAGLAGTTLMAVGGFGAAGILVHDPVLSDSVLGFWRYGHGREIAGTLIYVGLLLLAYAWVRLGREVLRGTVGGRAVVVAAAVWTLPMLVAPPMFTRDVYYYLAQGALPLAGIDPYVAGPGALPGPLSDNVADVWLDTPAPYGPLFMMIATATTWLTGNNVIAGVLVTRLVLLLGLALIAWALPALTRRMGGRVPVALWMVVANPVMIVHVIGGVHNDLLAAGLLTAAALLVLRGQHVGGIALASAATAIKITAGLALPFLVLVWAARLTGSPVSRIVRAAAAGIAVFVVVFGACSLPVGGPLGWLPALSGPATVIHWYSLPTGAGLLLNGIVGVVADLPAEPFIAVTRLLGGILLVIVAVRQWWAARDGGPDAVRRAGIVLIAAAVLGPTLQSWYFVWGIVLLAAAAWRSRGLAVFTALSLFFMVVTYPDGTTAQHNVALLVGASALWVLAAVSLHRRDPLGLGRPPRPTVEPRGVRAPIRSG